MTEKRNHTQIIKMLLDYWCYKNLRKMKYENTIKRTVCRFIKTENKIMTYPVFLKSLSNYILLYTLEDSKFSKCVKSSLYNWKKNLLLIICTFLFRLWKFTHVCIYICKLCLCFVSAILNWQVRNINNYTIKMMRRVTKICICCILMVK